MIISHWRKWYTKWSFLVTGHHYNCLVYICHGIKICYNLTKLWIFKFCTFCSTRVINLNLSVKKIKKKNKLFFKQLAFNSSEFNYYVLCQFFINFDKENSCVHLSPFSYLAQRVASRRFASHRVARRRIRFHATRCDANWCECANNKRAWRTRFRANCTFNLSNDFHKLNI